MILVAWLFVVVTAWMGGFAAGVWWYKRHGAVCRLCGRLRVPH